VTRVLTRASERGGAGRRVSSLLYRHAVLRLAALVTAPALWLVVVYLGSLALLLVTSVWTVNSFTGNIVPTFTFDNFATILHEGVYRVIVGRTVGIAAMVTVIDMVLAVPMAVYMARVAKPWARRLLVVAILTPLWSNYLVKAYAWKVMLSEGGLIDWLTHPVGASSPGFSVTSTTIVLAYLWLPYMILPIYAGLDRLPNSLLEASSDLGARSMRTFRMVVLPIIRPAIIAGSIFTFSLALGDYIAVQIVGGGTQMIGNVVYANVGAANNLPFAAALAVIPIVIMVVFLLAVRRTGALDEM
jgi:putative spermidine/putrescine transport system permease protein